MEVQLAWLETAPATEESPSPSPRKKPPRLPGAPRSMPAMPAMPTGAGTPPRRHTMEVEMSWVELVDEKQSKKSAAPSTEAKKTAENEAKAKARPSTSARPPSVRPPRPPSARPPAAEAASPRKRHKPIPRDE
jgi:hypothetical protein